MAEKTPNTNATSVDGVPEVDLRDARLAAFLAWLVPGLGHLYQRRTGKGLLFMITILGTFAYGMYLGGGRVVYASSTKPPIPMGVNRQALAKALENAGRWHYYCQLPVGIAALPAYVQTWRVESGQPPIDLFGDNFERPPYTPDQVKYFNGIGRNEELDPELKSKYFQSKDHAGNVVYHATEQQQWNHDRNYMFELGTVFTMIAGLMNVLAICDARWGPLVALPPPDEKSKDKKPDKPPSSD